MKRLQFAKLLTGYGVDVTFQRALSDQREHGQTRTEQFAEKEQVTEPVLPFAQANVPVMNGHETAALLQEGGLLEQGDLIWYSNQRDIPLNSVVLVHDKTYKVTSADSWQDFADVTIYYLRGLVGYV